MTFPGPLSWPYALFHNLNLAIFLGKASWLSAAFPCFLSLQMQNCPNYFIFHGFPWPTLPMTFQAWIKIFDSRTSHVFHYPCKPWWVLLNSYFHFFLFKFIQALLILQLDAFVNRRTKQKTENSILWHCLIFINMSWIFRNTINHTVNVNVIELLWCAVL